MKRKGGGETRRFFWFTRPRHLSGAKQAAAVYCCKTRHFSRTIDCGGKAEIAGRSKLRRTRFAPDKCRGRVMNAGMTGFFSRNSASCHYGNFLRCFSCGFGILQKQVYRRAASSFSLRGRECIVPPMPPKRPMHIPHRVCRKADGRRDPN